MTWCANCGKKLSVSPYEKNLDLIPTKRGKKLLCKDCAEKHDGEEKKKEKKDDGKGRLQVEFNTLPDPADLDVHQICRVGFCDS